MECREERSQYLNKQRGLQRLAAVLRTLNKAGEDRQNREAWNAHNQIERGNPIRVYEGWEFKRRK